MKNLIIPFLVFSSFLYCSHDAFAQTGCTDPISCNFDPLATVDDGSCIGAYPDINCDHLINVMDYMLFMNCLNCPADPATASIEILKCDFDGNGSVGLSDLIILISHYGDVVIFN
ncbi:MAG: hypothetical protein K1X54_07945 [Flavobacteriales bacterium]|nr:hypothetical protein [Flavobacteriales bacterium]